VTTEVKHDDHEGEVHVIPLEAITSLGNSDRAPETLPSFAPPTNMKKIGGTVLVPGPGRVTVPAVMVAIGDAGESEPGKGGDGDGVGVGTGKVGTGEIGDRQGGVPWYAPWSWYAGGAPAPAVGSTGEGADKSEVDVEPTQEAPDQVEPQAHPEVAVTVTPAPAPAMTETETNPLGSTFTTSSAGWASFFSSGSFVVKRITGSAGGGGEDVKRDEHGAEVMDVDEDAEEAAGGGVQGEKRKDDCSEGEGGPFTLDYTPTSIQTENGWKIYTAQMSSLSLHTLKDRLYQPTSLIGVYRKPYSYPGEFPS
jgi:hypothetical protein